MGLSSLFRKVIGNFRRRGQQRGEDEASEADEGLRGRLGRLLSNATPDPKDVTEKGARHISTAKDHATAWIEQGAGAAQDAARYVGERVQTVWTPEDSGQVLEGSHLFKPLPDESAKVAPELLSLQWRSEALLALSSVGVLSLEDEIIHHTDRLFHSGLPTPQLSERIFRRDLSELHRWIDTVPGSTVAGGGITHRLKHGHDLEAVAEIYEEHGLEGVLAWTQHVGQDVFSITGIPMPVGGKPLAELLVDRGITSPGKAALIVSFNAVELAASFLAGAFALRIAMLLKEMKSRRRVKKRCVAALHARERDDLDAVIANYAEARSLNNDPTLSLALGWAYREMGRPAAESFLEFRRAALGLGTQDRTIDLDGVAVSLRGLAYLLALVEAPQVLQRGSLRGAWREELERMARGAVASFEGAAISQSERPAVNLGERSLEWRPRRLSAAANYYLAARAVAVIPFGSSSVEMPRLRTNALQMLERAEIDADQDGQARLSSVAKRWDAELADEMKLLSRS